MLKIRNVKKKFGDTEVLKGIDLDIESGEILVVVGPSGGGKTTLLRCVNALEYCDSGDIEINGKTLCKDGKYVDKKSIRELRKDIGIRFILIDAYNHEKTINFYTKNLF